MLKKFLFALAFSLIAFPVIDSYAYSYIIYQESWGDYNYEIFDNQSFTPIVTTSTYSDGLYYDVYGGLLKQSNTNYPSADAAFNAAVIDQNLYTASVSTWSHKSTTAQFFGAFDNQTGNPLPQYNLPEPEEPQPGSDWLSDIWEWFLWQLGINDDYSGDIDEWITGGDRERINVVTPSPSPIPPSPTPYTLDIVDGATGTTIWQVEGVPGNTTINGGDTYNGSDFDIFAVDIQIGDGGSSNPKDGLNSIMYTSYDYLTEIDTTPVTQSFSLIPNDWFILIGILGGIPIIAGFITKLLK